MTSLDPASVPFEAPLNGPSQEMGALVTSIHWIGRAKPPRLVTPGVLECFFLGGRVPWAVSCGVTTFELSPVQHPFQQREIVQKRTVCSKSFERDCSRWVGCSIWGTLVT